MTIELHLPVFETLRIDACCRAAGLDFAAILARYANIITGVRPADTATRQPAQEHTAVHNAPAALPVAAAQAEKWKPAPPSLTRPGDILEAPEDIDWDDPALYV